MTEFKEGYIVDFNGQLATVLRVRDNVCVIQLNDHRKAVRKEHLKIVKADESSDIKTYRMEMAKEKEQAKEVKNVEETQKVCARCGKSKSLEEFSKGRGDHLRAQCKKCMGELISEGHKAKKQPEKTPDARVKELIGSLLKKDDVVEVAKVEKPITSRFKEITNEMSDLYERKNADYGNSFANSLDEFGVIAGVVRLSDKMSRVKALTKNDKQLVLDESLKDTLRDLANYSIMTLMWLEDNEGKNETD